MAQVVSPFCHLDYNPSHFPDRSTNGGWDYLPWFLDQVRQRSTNTNERLLDYFTVHYYPKGGEFGNDVSSDMQLNRNRSTRSFWDTNYIDASWINSVVKLVVTSLFPPRRPIRMSLVLSLRCVQLTGP
jgi:hypothetical protein